MAVPNADRVKASQLRDKLKHGKYLTREQRLWFDTYEASKAANRASRPPLELVPGPSSPSSSSGSFAQSTEAPNGHVDPSMFSWTPTVPAAVEGAPPPPPGASPPPDVGAPIVEPSEPTADPAAAAKFAALVAMLTAIGIDSARELIHDKAMPAQMRALLHDEGIKNGLLKEVAEAGYRVAIKYNFRSMPLQDELVVGGAVAGSVLAYLAVGKKRAANEQKRVHGPDNAPSEAPDATSSDGPPAARSPVPGLWS